MSLLAPSQPPLELPLCMPLPVCTCDCPANTTSTQQLSLKFEQVKAANRAVCTSNQQLTNVGKHEVKHKVGHKVVRKVGDKVEDKIKNKVEDKVKDKVEDKVEHKHKTGRGNTDVQEHDTFSSFLFHGWVTQGVAPRHQAQLKKDI